MVDKKVINQIYAKLVKVTVVSSQPNILKKELEELRKFIYDNNALTINYYDELLSMDLDKSPDYTQTLNNLYALVLIPEKKEGHGIKLRPSEHKINDKYYIDHQKLHNNVLEVRYNKNRHLTNLKSQIIGNGVKKIVLDVTKTGNIDTADYHKLQPQEQHLTRTVLNMFGKGHLLNDDDDEYNKQFQIAYDELMAGNNSIQLKQKVKQYIMHGIKIGKIPKHTGYNMLIELSL